MKIVNLETHCFFLYLLDLSETDIRREYFEATNKKE